MSRIKNIMLAAMLLTGGLAQTSCTDYQDEVDALDKRITILEELVSRTNQSIKGIEFLLNAVGDGWSITGIVEVQPQDDPKGMGYYTITFGRLDPTTGELSTKSDDKKAITVYNGQNGKDASSPKIEVRKGDDGRYYWYIDGMPLLGPDGLPVAANGKDGKDGVDGKPGKDGVSTAPIIDIDDEGYWIVSYDSGATWTRLTDAFGNPVSSQGADGKDADAIIKGVTIRVDTSGNRYVEFDLGGGQTVVVPLVAL